MKSKTELTEHRPHRIKFPLLLLTKVLITVLTSGKFALAGDESSSAQLLGDWGGVRTSLEDFGITVESILTVDFIRNVHGAIDKDSSVLGNYDLIFNADTEAMTLWHGGTLSVYLLGNANDGTLPSQFIGDLQASDNIEADEALKVYEAWYEQSFLDNQLGLLFGLHDYNSEFYVLEYAATLINSSFGIGPDSSQVIPSIFPTSSLALRVRLHPSEKSYLLAAVYDGIPGDPNNPRGTHIKLKSKDGLFYGLEAGLLGEEGPSYYKAGLGFWYHTAEFEDFAGVMRDENHGLYFIGEKNLFTEQDQAQGLGAFFQLGFTRESRNQTEQYLGAGLAYTGAIPTRDADVLSVGIAHARNGSEYQTSMNADTAETAIELIYRSEITPYFSISPDIQWIMDPGTVKEVDDALVLGVRVEVAM